MEKMEKYKMAMDEAAKHMSLLCGCDVENTKDGMIAARKKVYDRGNYEDNAKADFYFSQWMWGHCEMEAHKDTEIK